MGIQYTCECGKEFVFSTEHAGLTGNCKQCGRVITVPSPGKATEPEESAVPEADERLVEVKDGETLCAVCQTPLEQGQPASSCPSCKTLYHPECWEDNCGCGIYGCDKAPTPEPRKELEIPASFWGQEQKPCPSCGKTIQAAALRCRNCGAIFKSARPEDTKEFFSRKRVEKSLPKIRKGAVKIFIFCLIPLTAPFASLIGIFWHQSKKGKLEKLPPIYAAFVKLGLLAGIVQTFFIFLMTILYAIFRA